MARATDEAGRVQPQTKGNFMYKMFDGIVPVDVVVEYNGEGSLIC